MFPSADSARPIDPRSARRQGRRRTRRRRPGSKAIFGETPYVQLSADRKAGLTYGMTHCIRRYKLPVVEPATKNGERPAHDDVTMSDMTRACTLALLLAAGTLALAAQPAQPKVVETEKLADSLFILKGGGGNTAVFGHRSGHRIPLWKDVHQTGSGPARQNTPTRVIRLHAHVTSPHGLAISPPRGARTAFQPHRPTPVQRCSAIHFCPPSRRAVSFCSSNFWSPRRRDKNALQLCSADESLFRTGRDVPF